MEAEPPEWYEALMGAACMVIAAVAGLHIIHHPEHDHLYAWLFVTGFGMVGFWLLAPVKARTLWREMRDSLPFLQDTHFHEEDE